MKLNLALGQMDVTVGRPDINWQRAVALTQAAAARGAQLLLLPELWSTGYDLRHAGRHATPIDQGLFAAVVDLAHQHNITIIGSCLSRLGEGQYGNTLTVATPAGQTAVYSKFHLFRLMQEEQYLTAGATPTLADGPWGRAGLAICYDLRFPELFRGYALAGAQLIFLPAEWPHPRLSHWQILTRARAIENQVYLAACNRVGHSGATRFCGHSCIIDPWGETVVEGDESENLLLAEIDLAHVAEIRTRIPVFADRRPEVYQTAGV